MATTNNSTPWDIFRNQVHNQNTGSGGLKVVIISIKN